MPIEPWWETSPARTPLQELGMASLRQVNSGEEEETRTRKPFIEILRDESRLAKLDQQPEASLAWWWGDPSCEA